MRFERPTLLHLSWDFLHSDLMLQQLSHLADWKFTNFLIYNTSDKCRFFIQQFITVIYWLRRFRASNKYTKQNKQKRKAQNRREKNIREKRQHRAGDEVGSRAWPNEHGWSFIGRDLCSKRGDRLGRTFPVSLTSLGSLGAKANAKGLDVRNLTRSPKHGEGSVIRLSFGCLWTWDSLSSGLKVWFTARARGWLLGRNLALSSPTGAWFRIVLTALAYKVIEWPKKG